MLYALLVIAAMEGVLQHISITNVTDDMQAPLENASPRLSIFSSAKGRKCVTSMHYCVPQ